MEREPVSAFVIAYNEEENIADCIKSLLFCDEVILIDSFSTDRTAEIAKTLGATIIQRKWAGYRDQKAYGLSIVKHQWVLNLDADERVDEQLKGNILKVLQEIKQTGNDNFKISGYYINRVVFYLGRWWRKGGWYPEYRLRFFRKSDVTWGGEEPHEKPIIKGKTKQLGGEIQHYTYKNIDDQLARLQNFSSISAFEEYKKGTKASLKLLLINPILRTLKFYIFKKGYREGIAGLIVALFEGYYTFMKYAKLWELEFINKEKNKIKAKK